VNEGWTFVAEGEAAPGGGKFYDVTSVTVAETYVSRGKPNDVALAARKSGLEFQAISHPSSLFAGSEVKFAVLFDGKPLAGQMISVYRDHPRYADKKVMAEVKTDAAGRFAFEPEAQGVYLAMTRYRPTPAADSSNGVSYTYSVVFEVGD
jgi:uncharacterized GH25 family protein